MALEGFNKQSNKKSVWESAKNLGKIAVVGASVSFFNHGPAQAADIEPNTSFQAGITELQKSVREEPVEYGATFIKFKDGNTLWMKPMQGTETSVKSNTIIEIENHVSGKAAAETLLSIHTHPEAILKNPALPSQFKGATTKSWNPPSIADVSRASARMEATVRTVAQLTDTHFKYIVIDPKGGWFFEAAPEAEAREADPTYAEAKEKFQSLRKEYRAYMDELQEKMWAFIDKKDSPAKAFFQKLNPEWTRSPSAYDLLASSVPPEKLGLLLESDEERQLFTKMRKLGEEGRKAQDITQHAQAEFASRFASFISQPEGFSFETAYPLLQKDYLKLFGVKITFVPNEDLGAYASTIAPDLKKEQPR